MAEAPKTRTAAVAFLAAIPLVALTPLPANAEATGAAGAAEPAAEPHIETPGDWASELLKLGDWPRSGTNICAIVAWERLEGGQFVSGSASYNPLNTSQSMPGDSIFNGVGVRNYPSWSVGLDATVQTLQLGFYTDIVRSLSEGKDAVAVLAAVNASPWGTKFDDPAAPLDGSCLEWASEYNEKREAALARIAEIQKKVDATAAKANAAQAEQQSLDAKYQAMAAEIALAQNALNKFARDLYIVGMEPEAANQVTAIESGDPGSFALVQSYAAYAGRRDATELQHSLDLLAEVNTSREKATAALSSANEQLAAVTQTMAKAQGELEKLEKSPF